MTSGSGSSVTIPRRLLRDLMTALYRRGENEDGPLMQEADQYAWGKTCKHQGCAGPCDHPSADREPRHDG